MSKEKRRSRFQRRILILSQKRTYREAYEAAERLEVREMGDRMYKNYGSYRRCMHYHREKSRVAVR